MAASKILFNVYSFPVSLGQDYFLGVFTSTNHIVRNGNPEMVMGRTERNLYSYMAEFIKLVNGFSIY